MIQILNNNKVIKTDKTSLFDKVLTTSLKNLELLCQNDNFTPHEIEKFEKKNFKIERLIIYRKNWIKNFLYRIKFVKL